MKRLFASTAISIYAAAMHGADISADSARGAQVFELQECVACHALNGVGTAIGPDLGLLADRGFTPASLAATMWNHAPAMWVETRLRSVARPAMDEQQAIDLFAFFYSLRFFEEPGDAARGKTLFSARKCASCHGVTAPKLANAKPVNQWTASGDPLELVETMWNHSTAMRAEMARNKIALPRLSGQDLADLLVYVRSVQGVPRRRSGVFRVASAELGKELFESKSCMGCHDPVTRFFAIGPRNETLTDIAADMWNHGRDMNVRTVFEPGQMRAIAAYIWSRRVIENGGAANAGAKVFAAKKCSVCHDDRASGAPALVTKGQYFSAASMVSALTRHGPLMLDRMREKRLAWPHFSAGEMADLIAYLNIRNSRNGS